MHGFLIIISFLFASLSVDAQENWFAIKAEKFWEIKAVQEEIQADNFNRTLLEAALFHAGNEARIAQGKEVLVWNTILNKAARHQSDLMANGQVLSHTWRRPHNSRKLVDRVELFGGRFSALGENIAQFYLLDIPENEEYSLRSGIFTDEHGHKINNKSYKKLAEGCIKAWMNSPGHRENLLFSFQEIGTGVSFWVENKKGLNFDIYLCQNFATP